MWVHVSGEESRPGRFPGRKWRRGKLGYETVTLRVETRRKERTASLAALDETRLLRQVSGRSRGWTCTAAVQTVKV